MTPMLFESARALARREGDKRFVEEEHTWLEGDRPPNRHGELLHGREVIDARIAVLRQAERAGHLCHAQLALGARQAGYPQAVTNILRDAPVSEERRILEHEAHSTAVWCEPRDVAAEDLDDPMPRAVESRNGAE